MHLSRAVREPVWGFVSREGGSLCEAVCAECGNLCEAV